LFFIIIPLSLTAITPLPELSSLIAGERRRLSAYPLSDLFTRPTCHLLCKHRLLHVHAHCCIALVLIRLSSIIKHAQAVVQLILNLVTTCFAPLLLSYQLPPLPPAEQSRFDAFEARAAPTTDDCRPPTARLSVPNEQEAPQSHSPPCPPSI
jgi:hypothetical protein